MLLDYDEPKRPLASAEYFAPAPGDIAVENGKLFWEPVWPDPGPRRIRPTVETFKDFLKLGESDIDREVLRFAKRWGVLNLCKRHRDPVSHDGNCIPVVRYGVRDGEPISEWR